MIDRAGIAMLVGAVSDDRLAGVQNPSQPSVAAPDQLEDELHNTADRLRRIGWVFGGHEELVPGRNTNCTSTQYEVQSSPARNTSCLAESMRRSPTWATAGRTVPARRHRLRTRTINSVTANGLTR